MTLNIKNMVSNRCKAVVKSTLETLGWTVVRVDLGEVEVLEDLSAQQRERFHNALRESDLELIEDKKAILIEKIKVAIVEVVHYSDAPLEVNFSKFLTEKLLYDYTYLSNLFSEMVGTTIEQFVIAHKIERVKALIAYGELNLTEISYLLNYSSVGHLSFQFKKVTGMTPTEFKTLKIKRQVGLDQLQSDRG